MRPFSFTANLDGETNPDGRSCLIRFEWPIGIRATPIMGADQVVEGINSTRA